MKKFTKVTLAVLSVTVALSLVGGTFASANTISSNKTQTETTASTSKYYSDQLDKVYQDYLQNEKPYLPSLKNQGQVQPRIIGPVIGHILKFTFKELAKRGTGATVAVTTRSVAANITKHAIEEAIEDGITTLMIDNLLSEKSSGMRAIEKYYDMSTGARVVYDPNNKITAILDRDENNIFTIYNDANKNTIDYRVNIKKRWWKSLWRL